MYEIQISLADAYEKTGEKEKAEELFNECFQMMDGRDGQSNYGRGMSIKSKLSRNLSIKSKLNTMVTYGRSSGKMSGGQNDEKEAGKANAMQRVAVTLRQKQEYGRAERLMSKAIQVKRQILGNEISEDIAYLYNELAVTY